MSKEIKEISISEIVKKAAVFRESVEQGPVRITWREPKPGGKVVFSVIAQKESEDSKDG